MSKKKGRKYKRRNKHQKASDIQKSAHLRKQGKSLREISKETGNSHETVRLDLAIIDNELLEQAEIDLKTSKAHQLAKARFGQIQSLKSWASSIGEVSTTRHESGVGAQGLIDKKVTTTKIQTGDPRHLKNYLKFVEMENKLLGLDKPTPDLDKEKEKESFWEVLGAKLKESYGTPKPE